MRQLRRRRVLLVLSALFLIARGAQAQKKDWKAVRELSPGTAISVTYGHSFVHNRCVFQSATEDALVCERVLYGSARLFVPPEAVFGRKLVREVRLEHSDASNALVGAAIGGGIGVALGAAGSRDTSAKARLDLGLLVGAGGALLGGVIGREFPVRHGQVIYHR